MKKIIFSSFLVLTVAACDTRTGTTAAGAAIGAGIGASVSGDDDKVTGALVGATAGAITGNLIGKANAGNCLYQRPDGSQYTAACP